jgi:DNA-binding transcriptional regulator YiaG
MTLSYLSGMQRSSLAISRTAELRNWIASGAARRVRNENHLSLDAVARELDVTAAAVLRWERGDHFPRGRNQVTYHRLLGRLISSSSAPEVMAS